MSLPISRLGDSFTDGDIIAQGSGNVFCNGIPISRLGDSTTGEGCFPSVIISSGSGVTFVNNIPVARLGDKKLTHSCPDNGSHDGTISSASGNVFSG